MCGDSSRIYPVDANEFYAFPLSWQTPPMTSRQLPAIFKSGKLERSLGRSNERAIDRARSRFHSLRGVDRFFAHLEKNMLIFCWKRPIGSCGNVGGNEEDCRFAPSGPYAVIPHKSVEVLLRGGAKSCQMRHYSFKKKSLKWCTHTQKVSLGD